MSQCIMQPSVNEYQFIFVYTISNRKSNHLKGNIKQNIDTCNKENKKKFGFMKTYQAAESVIRTQKHATFEKINK